MSPQLSNVSQLLAKNGNVFCHILLIWNGNSLKIPSILLQTNLGATFHTKRCNVRKKIAKIIWMYARNSFANLRSRFFNYKVALNKNSNRNWLFLSEIWRIMANDLFTLSWYRTPLELICYNLYCGADNNSFWQVSGVFF